MTQYDIDQQVIEKRPEWLENNVNGRVVQELKKIRDPKDVIANYLDTRSWQLENAFKYQWKKVGIWVIFHGVEVGDHEAGIPQYIAPLWDVFRVPDLLKAIKVYRCQFE